jgi:DNA-binding beta-propeller fold protein YncE
MTSRELSLGSIIALLVLGLAGFQLGCGGGGSSAPPPPPPPAVSVSVSPSTASVLVGNTQQFTATVQNTTNTAVTWQVNGVTGGNATVGTISATGLYSAPDPAPSPATVPVTAVSQADSSKSGSATVSLFYPAPVLNSVSPNLVAAGSSDTTVTLFGSGFSHASVASVSGTQLATAFPSPTQLTAIIPANLLKSAASDKISVSNPGPGGGTSGAQSFTIAAVGTVTLFSVPATVGNTAGPWQLIVAVVDPQGNPIPNLFVTLQASSGALSSNQGITDTAGSFSTTINPPTDAGPGSATAVSAIVGDRIASVNLSFVSFGAAASAREPQRTNQQQSSSPSFTQELFEFGVSTGPSSAGNPSPLIQHPDPCYTPLDLTEADSTAACAPLYATNHVTVNVANLVNEGCQLLTDVILPAKGVLDCAGTVAIAAVCLATPALEVVCVGNLSTILTSGPVLPCVTFIAHLIARHFQNQTAIQIVDAVGITTVTDLKTGLLKGAGVICDALQAASSTGPRIYVTNSGDGTVSAFNESGQLLFSFSGLVTPDGIAYDAVKQQLYITDVGDDTIKVYSLDGLRVDVGTAFPTNPGGNPEDITFDPVNRRFYVNDTTFNSVLVYDETGSPVPASQLATGAFSGLSQPFGITFNPVTGLIYVANSDVNKVLVFDQDGAPQPQGEFAGLFLPDDMTWDPATGNIYIVNDGDSSVKAYKPDGTLVPTPGGFQGLDLPDQIIGDGNFLSPKFYVTSIQGNSVQVFDRTGKDITPSNGFQKVNQPTGVVVVP